MDRSGALLTLPLLDRLADVAVGGAGTQGHDGRMSSGRAAAVAMVARELDLLLNSSCLGSMVDLDPYPLIRTSVLNYGMPSLAGVAVGAVEPPAVAERIRLAITTFEPRLREVRVTPEAINGPRAEVRFRIQGLLMIVGEPAPVVMETQIALGGGEVRVSPQGVG